MARRTFMTWEPAALIEQPPGTGEVESSSLKSTEVQVLESNSDFILWNIESACVIRKTVGSLSPVYFTFHKKIGIKVVSWEELAGRVKSWKRMGRGRTPHKPWALCTEEDGQVVLLYSSFLTLCAVPKGSSYVFSG